MFEQMTEGPVQEAPHNLTTDQELMVRTALLGKEVEILTQRLRALEVGFSELHQHLGPLLDALKKPEFLKDTP